MIKKIFVGRTSRLQFFTLNLLFFVFVIWIESPISLWANFGNGIRGVMLFFPFFTILCVRRYHDVGLSLFRDSLNIGKFSYFHLIKTLFLKGNPFDNEFGKPPMF